MKLEDIGREAHEINALNGWDVFQPADWDCDRSDEDKLTSWAIGEPHYMAPDTDCMGGDVPGYWRVFATSRVHKQSSLFGFGQTAEECVADANAKILKEADSLKLCTHMALVHTEVSEATEAVRHRDRQNFDEELADVVIRVASIAHGLGTDLEGAIKAKLAINRTRGLHHGGKAL